MLYSAALASAIHKHLHLAIDVVGFSGGSEGKESACSAGDPGLIPESGRSPGEGDGYPLQCSCLQTPTDREPPRVDAAGQLTLSHWCEV